MQTPMPNLIKIRLLIAETCGRTGRPPHYTLFLYTAQRTCPG